MLSTLQCTKEKNQKDIGQGGEQTHKIGYLFRHNGGRKRSTAAALVALQYENIRTNMQTYNTSTKTRRCFIHENNIFSMSFFVAYHSHFQT